MKRWILTGFLILSAIGVQVRAAPGDAALSSYEMAFGLTRAGSFGLAETAWRNFLSQYPDHPLASNAQYFLGETFYGRNDFAHAAIAYGIGADKYPQSEVAPQTLLKLGIALGRLGETGHPSHAFPPLHPQFSNVTPVAKLPAPGPSRQRTPAVPARTASREAPRVGTSGASSADAIKTAQTLLAALDYDPGPVDGQPGAKLRDAVRAFEKRNDMRPDGEVSDKLLQRLSAAVLSVSRKAPATAAPASPPGVLAVRRTAGTGFVVSKSGF